MAIPEYDAVGGAPRLYALQDASLPGEGYWAGYYASAGSAFGANASIAQAWNDIGGVYLFLGETPADFSAFVAGLQALLPALSPTGSARFLWIANPASAASWKTWRTQLLDAVPAVPGSGSAWLVGRQMAFALGAYSLSIQGGTALSLADSEASGYAAVIADAGVNFYAPGCGYPAQGGSRLNLAGAAAGCFAADLLLKNDAGDDMASLGVMLRYAAPDAESLFGETKMFPMPLLSNAGIDLAADFAYDPLNPLQTERSYLGIYPGATPTPPSLPTSLATTRGYAITLAPSDGGGSLPSARLGFCRTPLFASPSGQDDAYDYYLSPDGAFTLSVVPPAGQGTVTENDLMLGVSGIESVALPATGNPLLLFRCGQAAFVPAPSDPEGSDPQENILTGFATTAYAMALPAASGNAGLTYYAQPLQAPLFQSLGDLGSGFMDFHAMPSATLPAYSATPSGNASLTVMPIGAYKWADPAYIEWARSLEASVLSPLRRAAVGLPTSTSASTGLAAAAPGGPLPAEANPDLAVTPQGLIAKLTADLQAWAGVTLANMPASLHKEVELTAVGAKMQAALQSNQLFFVVSNVDNFMAQSSVRYQLTEFDMELLKARNVPDAVLASLRTAYGALPTVVYATENDFLAPYPTDADSQKAKPDVLAVTGLMECDIEGWTFQISPRSWRQQDPYYRVDPARPVADPTLMLFKFCNRSLVEWVEDGGSWGWQEAAWDNNTNRSIVPTQKVLRDILANARENYQLFQEGSLPPTDPLVIFYRDVALNPMWNGVLFFNAPVDFTQMPEALQFLAAGIDTKAFYAHHLGFSVTPFNPVSGGIELQQTAAFGLINYLDTADLVADASIPFGFKTMQLQVRFANARVADFAAQVELMLNDLFGSALSKQDSQRGNNLILDGSYQRSGGLPAYSFVLSGENVFSTAESVLTGVEVLSVQLAAGAASDVDLVVMQFILAGNMRFALLEGFDLFSYGPDALDAGGADGYLRFGNLAVTMSFERAAPETQAFRAAEGAVSFDAANSHARAASLVNNFPLSITQLLVSPNLAAQGGLTPVGQTPEDMGYTSISAPFDQTPMVPSWYGLAFTLDLGTFGALVGSLGFKVSLLAAWSRGKDMPAYLGLKLPNIPAVGGSIPLQGVLKLGFRSFEFSTYAADPGVLGYMLTLRRFALSVLCWSFPPGNTDVRLFGAPGQPKGSLGWYAAYDDGKGPDGAQGVEARASGGNALPPEGTTMKALPAPKEAPPPPPAARETAAERRLRSGRRTRPAA